MLSDSSQNECSEALRKLQKGQRCSKKALKNDPILKLTDLCQAPSWSSLPRLRVSAPSPRLNRHLKRTLINDWHNLMSNLILSPQCTRHQLDLNKVKISPVIHVEDEPITLPSNFGSIRIIWYFFCIFWLSLVFFWYLVLNWSSRLELAAMCQRANWA